MSLLNAQRKLLYDEINKKKFNEKLYRARSNELVSLKDFSTWMKYGNIDLRAERIYCYIQDRNVFWRDDALQCQHCGKAENSFDYLVAGCARMLGHDYTRRNNEVIRRSHLLSKALKNPKNYDLIQSRRSWKMKKPKFGSIQG
ncbi:hypothetical protein TCON_2199 [Astathelohania contejeani]|uniref:Uncharacterized protein n=1 Tax=Astathelohania contejeani TaxID=164912 RepID=A0ABQ7HWS7_9MICR|nr:hypothetical protein TCON_2199 [Thelohania contejeani]